jgi:Resolvase, N terminal domain
MRRTSEWEIQRPTHAASEHPQRFSPACFHPVKYSAIFRSRHVELAAKRAPVTAKSKRVYGQRQEPAKMFRVGLYARVSTHDQKTLPLQIRTMREYASKRGWEIAFQIQEIDSGAVERELREKLMAAARRREIAGAVTR